MQAFDTAKDKWGRTTRSRQIAFGAGLILILCLLIGGAYWITRDDYQVLFSELSGPDAGAMVGELDRMKVPYRLADNGSTILVERDTVYKTRLKLMAKGLDLHGTVGFEIFNTSDFGTTEFAQKVNYQRAMQGELARTIMGFDEIKHARVHLVLPDSGLFKRQNAKPKASVSIVMKGDSLLQAEQITGIQRLIAASVPEIQPSAVTIVNQHGSAVSQSLPAEDTEQTAPGRLDNKKRTEEYLIRKIVTVLDKAIGPGKAIVSVDAQLNYDQARITREDIVPLPNTSGQNVGAVVRRRDSSQGGDGWGDFNSFNGTSTNRSLSSSSSEVEYANARKVENVVTATGGVQRLSVGVLVPGVSDPVELAKLSEIVAMAAGINSARGDAIAVYNVAPQDNVAAENTANTSSSGRMLVSGGPSAPTRVSLYVWLALLAITGLGFLLWRAGAAHNTNRRLSAEERERMLREVLQWAQTEKSREPG